MTRAACARRVTETVLKMMTDFKEQSYSESDANHIASVSYAIAVRRTSALETAPLDRLAKYSGGVFRVSYVGVLACSLKNARPRRPDLRTGSVFAIDVP